MMIGLKVGMSLKQVDETLLADWIDWSKQADNFEDGVCERKWNTFEVVEEGLPVLKIIVVFIILELWLKRMVI